MANEAREAAIKVAIQKFKDENLENPNSALPTDIRVILTDGIRLGYDAHESAIRTAAEALMKSIERSEQTLLQLEGSIFAAGFETTLMNIRQPVAALKAALAKERE